MYVKKSNYNGIKRYKPWVVRWNIIKFIQLFKNNIIFGIYLKIIIINF